MSDYPSNQTSATLGFLADALAKAQGEFKQLPKSKTAKIKSPKGDYSYKYADLSDVLEATTAALSKNGLAVFQTFAPALSGVMLITRLVHSSGEWMASLLPLDIPAGRPQELGAIITFYRRYALSSILNVAADGGDGAPENGNNGPKGISNIPPRPTPPPPAKTPVKIQHEILVGGVQNLNPLEFCPAGPDSGKAWIEMTEDQLLNYKLKISEAIEDPAKVQLKSRNETSLLGVQKALDWLLEAASGNSAFGA